MALNQPSSSASSLRSPSPTPHATLRATRSFSRYDPSEPAADPLSTTLARLKRESPAEEALAELAPLLVEELSDDEDGDLGSGSLPEDFDELPSDIVALVDRFIDSLTKPIHPAPLSINELSEIFQQFYGTASQAIGSHVQNTHLYLSSKKGQKTIPTQMLSRAEMSQKKRDRKLLEAKKIALEEAVEKRVANGVYEKLWRHKNTDDEARDDSLHSKIAALKVVGVNLGHLGVEVPEDKREGLDAQLMKASASLAQMNEERYPLGKLVLLKQAHKTIVDCLTTFLATTSADSLLPALIYTLILSPPEPPLNAVSNLVFILRFRTSGFIDGEAAYCLTNLEAAISFLETVDLASLNLDGSVPFTPSSTNTPKKRASLSPEDQIYHLTERLAKTHNVSPTTATTSSSVLSTQAITSSPSTSPTPITSTQEKPTTTHRKLTFLTPVDLATSAVSTADQSIRNLGNTLENSYKFLFQHVPTPRTLEDARKLVDTPTNTAEGVLKRTESTDSVPSLRGEAGRTAPVRSASSSLRTPSPAAPHVAAAAAAAVALDPLKHIGSSIGRFAAFGARGFTRSAASSPAPAPAGERQLGNKDPGGGEVRDLLTTFPELKGQLGLDGNSESKVVDMPKRGDITNVEKLKVDTRFLEVKDARELRIGDVEGLLKEYQRLVKELGEMGLV
ncbi:hypothetical protein EX30DRAFT_395041 [Ascodesmis nigricans]|uniref:VPS9 domain-containing protein n=1 Tax=Ascodesmis nigricans TaxID=341454 RepID=A0A4S2MZE4_9PEZI|nr:hypothetical protein EX30DRAFT_395041 [Ascodesmis nigricans]